MTEKTTPNVAVEVERQDREAKKGLRDMAKRAGEIAENTNDPVYQARLAEKKKKPPTK